jgi:hypothetical protein
MLRFQRHVYPTLMVLILALSGLPQGCSMASSSKLCLFSEVQGIVLKSGQPVVNAQVKRYYTWAWKNDQRYQDETTTDAEGRFRFPAALESSFWGSWLPHEPQILQRIDIHVGEQCIPGVVARKAELPNPGGSQRTGAHPPVRSGQRTDHAQRRLFRLGSARAIASRHRYPIKITLTPISSAQVGCASAGRPLRPLRLLAVAEVQLIR